MVGKVQHGNLILQFRKQFHKVGPRKSNFIFTNKIWDVSEKASLTCPQKFNEILELSRALGPHEFNLSEGVHSEISSSSFKLVLESSLEAADIKIPELPPPLSQVDMFRLWSHHQDWFVHLEFGIIWTSWKLSNRLMLSVPFLFSSPDWSSISLRLNIPKGWKTSTWKTYPTV